MIVLHLDPLLLLGVGLLLLLFVILTILVGLHLSRKVGAHYDDIREVEETFRQMASDTWRYTEAVDDLATRGEGTTLYRRRLLDQQASAGQPGRH